MQSENLLLRFCLFSLLISNVALQPNELLLPSCDNCLMSLSAGTSSALRRKKQRQKPVSNATVSGLKPNVINEMLMGGVAGNLGYQAGLTFFV